MRLGKEISFMSVRALKPHISLNVKNVEASVDFYKRLFGIEHGEYFPLVAVRVASPRLILQSVAAVDLHFVDRDQAGFDPSLACFKYVVSRLDLDPKV